MRRDGHHSAHYKKGGPEAFLCSSTTTRPDAFRGKACCGSDPMGHAKSQVGNRCSRKHNRLRAFGLRTVCSDNVLKIRATRLGRILPPRVQYLAEQLGGRQETRLRYHARQ
jgi:hypothetical protein